MAKVATFDVESLPAARRFYPVEIHVHATYVVWLEGKSPEDAADQADNTDGDITHGADQLDGWFDAKKTTQDADYRVPKPGPLQACPDCGAVEREVGSLAWAHHEGTCPRHIHHVHERSVWGDTGVAGWLAACSCRAEGLNPPNGMPDLGSPELEGVTVYQDREEVAAILRAHVADRPHSKNVPMGITESRYYESAEG